MPGTTREAAARPAAPARRPPVASRAPPGRDTRSPSSSPEQPLEQRDSTGVLYGVVQVPRHEFHRAAVLVVMPGVTRRRPIVPGQLIRLLEVPGAATVLAFPQPDPVDRVGREDRVPVLGEPHAVRILPLEPAGQGVVVG